MPPVGIEPTTFGLKSAALPAELRRRVSHDRVPGVWGPGRRTLALELTYTRLNRQSPDARPRPTRSRERGSVAEVAAAGEHHRRAGGVDRLDDLVIAHRAAGLDDRGRRPPSSASWGPSANGK